MAPPLLVRTEKLLSRWNACRDLRYCLALLAAALVFHRHVLFYPNYVFPWDFRTVHVPSATFIADSIRSGIMPLWDPYTYCGVPFFANIQAALFYPPALAAEFLGAWLGPEFIPRLLAIAVVLQVAFAGVCTFALLRRIGIDAPAAWIGATVYELGCFFAAQAEHMGAMQGASWLPLCWLCVIEIHRRIRWRWVGLLATALCMSVLAGLPQVSVAVFASAVLLSCLLALRATGSWRSLSAALVGCGWALLLAAVQFFPTQQLVRYSVAQYRPEWLGTGGGIPPSALLSLVIPNYWSVFNLEKFHGPIDLTFLYFYSSIFGLVLALAAVIWKPRFWGQVFGVLLALDAMALMGDKTPVGRAILSALPLSVRIGIHPEFFLCVFSLGLAVLAGIGADRFLRNTRIRLVVGMIVTAELILVSSGRPMNMTSLESEPGFVRDSADGSSQLLAQLRRLTGATVPPSRYDTTVDVSFSWSHVGPLWRIPTSNGCDPLAPARLIQVRTSFSPGPRWGSCFQVMNFSSPVVRLVNDRFLVSRAEINDPAFRLAAQTGGYRIYENLRALPRYLFPLHLTVVKDLAASVSTLRSPQFRVEEDAVVEGLEARPADQSSGRVDVLSYSANDVTLRVETPSESFLVATDAYYPGWEATVDGNPTSVYIADVAFRGMAVPPGTHEVRMRFAPRILYWSAGVSALALAALILVGIRGTSGTF
jgi:hypothetical protein